MKRKKKRDGVLVMVYGTLKRGNKNEHYMREAYEFLGEGETVRDKFLLVNMTGRLRHWFPGAVELFKKTHKKAGSIKGEVYLIPYNLLRRLDAHEGCYVDSPRRGNNYGYYRKRLKVDLDSGRTVVAEVYLMTPERAIKGIRSGGNLVEGGDWQEPEWARARRLHNVHRLFEHRASSLSSQTYPLAIARAKNRFRGR